MTEGVPNGLELDDAATAAIKLVGRTGARALEIGYQHDDVPVELAGWYASVLYPGTRVTTEDHRGPGAAVTALAERLLTGAECQHCRGLVALRPDGAMAHIGAVMADGTVMTEERARSAPQCRWRIEDDEWVRGCARRDPMHMHFDLRPRPAPGERMTVKPNRADRRAAKRGGRR